jgi:acetyl esterase
MAKQIKEYTQEQLLRKARRVRRMISIFAPYMTSKAKNRIGTEIFLDTEEGRIRVLAYNIDNPERLPLFVNIHGGGFVLGSAEMDDPFMLPIAEKANVKILNIDYSLSPDFPFPKAINECYAVVKYAKEHPDEFGIDPDRIAVGGQSAGGNFTAAICLMENERKQLGLKCAVLDYPPLDVYTDASEKPRPKGALPVFLSRMFDPCYLNDKEGRKNPLISPVFAEIEKLRSFPPTLVITASRDSLCAEAERFRDMLKEAGVEVAHKRFDAIHGFNLKPSPETDESWQMIIDFLKQHI